jgi:cell division protein FtsI/penicillin-binding protein 2
VFAYSVDADSIYAVPTEIADPAKAASSLCGALADCTVADRQALAERIRRGRAFVYVRRQVTPDQARRVAALELEGVGFMKENRRFYPNKELAAHLLGYVGVDNNGLAGVEATYDNLIKGTRGHGAHSDRRQAARIQPGRTSVDNGRGPRADDRPVSAAHRRA